MFLITSMVVVIVVFWISALLAEVILGSSEERKLHPIVRVGFGFFLSVIYFSAAWQLMPIEESWVLGCGLFFIYAYGKFGFSSFKNGLGYLRQFSLKYGKAFVAFLVGSVIFFAPNIISGNAGPFTEGGGDITIYADTAKVLTDHRMTALGQVKPNLEDQVKTVKALLNFSAPKYEKYREIQSEFKKSYGSFLNPPIADVSAYRVVQDTFFSSIYYLPYAQFYFLSGQTNYNVYFGIQAFLYVCLLGAVWGFFVPFGKTIPIIAVTVVAVSHGLISVYYNHYSMQGISLTITALILAAVPTVRFFSWAGLRIYGSVWIVIAVLYSHFLAIITPLMLLGLFPKPRDEVALNPPVYASKKPNLIRRTSRTITIAVFWALTALYLLSGGAKSVEFLQGLLANFLSRSTNAYLGEHISYLSLQWMSFLFGILSQQHFQPFASEIQMMSVIVGTGVLAGTFAIVLGGLMMAKISFSGAEFNRNKKFYLLVYVVAIIIVASHLYLARASLYTQAKGAQNVIVYFYVFMLLPLALSMGTLEKDSLMLKALSLLKFALIAFMVALVIPRVAYSLKIAYGKDRAAILEASYFSEAKRIYELDKSPYVLFEPRKSADLYLSIQPFSGERMLPTRHLALELLDYQGAETIKRSVLGSDLIETEDIPHLWLLRAERKDKWPSLGIYTYKWISQRLVDKKEPDILLFGNDYDRNFGERVLNVATKKMAKFSYVRNGSAMLYLPAGATGTLEVTLESRDEKNFEGIAKEVGERLKKGEMGSNVAMTTDGKFITLTTQLATADKPTLKTIARYSSEFWLNVSLNGKEI